MELKELSAKVDSYVKARDKRLAAQRKTDELKEQEDHLKMEIITDLRVNKVSAVGGKQFVVTLTTTDKPTASDWTKVYEYIHENDAYDLLQRRLNESAVLLRWEDGIQIPGVTKFPVEKLSISKR